MRVNFSLRWPLVECDPFNVHAYGRANECSPFIVVIEWVLTENKLKQNKMRIDARHTHTASCHGEWSLRNWRNTHTQSFQIAQKRLKSEPKYRISLIPYLHEKFKYLSIFCGGDGGSDAANATIDTYKSDRMTQFFSSLSPKMRMNSCAPVLSAFSGPNWMKSNYTVCIRRYRNDGTESVGV